MSVDDKTCAVPQNQYDRIVLGHGSGGRLAADLLKTVFLAGFRDETLAALEDQATLSLPGQAGARVAFTTDSFVVKPLFFPGGDIGKLAVCGTVNDLAVGGARPLFLSAAFILEEGFPIADLERVVASMRATCEIANVRLVTGDTKVVNRGACDGMFITTSGIGITAPTRNLSIANARPGDKILVSGTIGDHGIAILSVRDSLEFDTVLESDCAPLAPLVETVLERVPDVRLFRDATRGGVTSVLYEIGSASNVGIEIDEKSIPLRDEVRGACEMLGLDPLYVANEGKLVSVVPAEHASAALEAMRSHPLGKTAAIVGSVVESHPRRVTMRTAIGTERVVTMLAGEQLPRIC